jgi:O-antigen/teichoic acid export membrane protein
VLKKLRELSISLTVYGVGDVAVQLANFFLLPLYVHLLSPTDYGVIGVLLVVEQILRVVYRWGIDGAFMRFYYDCEDQAARQLLASTICFFLLGVSGTLLAAGVIAAPWVSHALFGSPAWTLPFRLVLINAFLGCLSFLPFFVLRIEGQAGTFVKLTFATNVSTLLSKLVFVAGFRMGVPGVYWADLVVAVGMLIVLLPRYAALIRPRFSPALLRTCLSFSLPRVPHGIAHQLIAGVDRYLLSRFVPLKDVGIYNVGASLGFGLKLFLSAFETAWAPFYFSEMKLPGAKDTFRTVTTYGFGVLVLLAAGLAATASDIVRLMTAPRFYGAAEIVPWIGMAVVLQGVYLLTSIGLNISKRTGFYPISTGIAAATAVCANLFLIPRYGVLGAAWSTMIAYGVLAATGMAFSQYVYPLRYEWGRLARLVVAGVAATAAGRMILPATTWPPAGIFARGLTTVAVYVLVLTSLGFFEPRETRRMQQLVTAVWSARKRPARTTAATAPEDRSDGEA